jgi:TonB family protein
VILKVAYQKPKRKPVGFLLSLCAHAIFFVWVAGPAWSSKSPSEYDQVIRPRETQLVWYNFKQKLPDVSPAHRTAENKPLLAKTVSKQAIVSAPKDAPDAKQMIFHPVPELKPEPPKPLPNMIALSLPPPPKNEVKVAAMPDVPKLAAKVDAPQLFNMPKVSKPFVRPAEHQAKLTLKVRTVEAPDLTPGAAAPGAASKVLDQASHVMAFRPQPKPSITASVGSMPDAPMLDGATASTANVAIVGLNPIDTLQRPVTEASRKAQFAAGPQVNPNGATSSGASSGITVPDLTIRGSAPDAKLLLAKAMPSTLPSAAAALREASTEHARPLTGSEIGRAVGAPVSGPPDPDPRFLGRQVFSMAIQSPNLTSHRGSWLMWYADRALLTYKANISAPQPLHKVDPKYIATAAEERIEGTVRLAFVIGHDGKVYDIQAVKGIDARLDRSAVEALQKWTFTPAERDGKPVDVDAVVEIPFRLAPRETP